jgi:prepilin-type N-terminal cleavage/methylation domain-containing protein
MCRRSTPGQRKVTQRGFSFVEVLITAAIVALVFGGLFASVQAMLSLIADSKARSGAVALATERLEYIRSLSYADVGTVGAPPFGAIPQTRQVTLNGITYDERVLIRYTDGAGDGLAGADSNSIIEDFKTAKVEYSWPGRSGTSTIALTTLVVPIGVESTTGGGSLRVYVNDANVQPVANAAVTVTNTTLATTTNTTQFANLDGELLLSGLPAGGGYNISVTLPGYSIDGTATPTPPLSSPLNPVISITEAITTPQYFYIDELSTLEITTASLPTFGEFFDDFTDASGIATTSTTTISSNTVVLTGSAGSYPATGTVASVASSPSPLDSWYTISFSASTSASTSVAVQVAYLVGTTTTLVPEGDLPGNTTGFTSSPIDISVLDPATYPDLAVLGVLTSSDPNETPALSSWRISYIESQPNLAGVPMTIVGGKTLGTDAFGGPVYKTEVSDSTDGSGELTLADIEYDSYTITVDDVGVDVVEVCPSETLLLAPGTTETVDFTISAIAGNRLRVSVVNVGGDPVPGVDVRVEQASGYDETQTTGLCGQTFFSGGMSAATATVTASRSGYTTTVTNNVDVHASASVAVIIN